MIGNNCRSNDRVIMANDANPAVWNKYNSVFRG